DLPGPLLRDLVADAGFFRVLALVLDLLAGGTQLGLQLRLELLGRLVLGDQCPHLFQALQPLLGGLGPLVLRLGFEVLWREVDGHRRAYLFKGRIQPRPRAAAGSRRRGAHQLLYPGRTTEGMARMPGPSPARQPRAAMTELYDQIQEAAAAVRARWAGRPRVGIILGTGLGGLAEEVEADAAIP